MFNNTIRNTWLILFLVSLLQLAGCSRTETKSVPGTVGGDASPKLTLIELGSVNCIPCMKMQLVMREIEQQYGDQVSIVFYDVWTEAGKPYAQQYRIRVIPTQVFLDRDDNEYFRHEGYFPKEDLIQVLRLKGLK